MIIVENHGRVWRYDFNARNMLRRNLLNTVSVFGLCNEVKNMINRGHFWNRAHWRELIWKRAWELEDVFWCLKSRCHSSLDMLSKICSTTRYIIWWQLADRFPNIISNCEVMVKIICHASLLKAYSKSMMSDLKVCQFLQNSVLFAIIAP